VGGELHISKGLWLAELLFKKRVDPFPFLSGVEKGLPWINDIAWKGKEMHKIMNVIYMGVERLYPTG